MKELKYDFHNVIGGHAVVRKSKEREREAYINSFTYKGVSI